MMQLEGNILATQYIVADNYSCSLRGFFSLTCEAVWLA